jgi:hypothetical protein
MSGNILFLVCGPCEKANKPDFGAKVAGRLPRGYYEHLIPTKQLDNWFARHAKCGGRTNPDHFKLGYSYTLNHDQKELEAAVKLALVQ